MKITIHVKAGQRSQPRAELKGNELWVYVREPAQDGKANKAVVELLAKELGIAKSLITIESGHTAPIKRLEVNCEENIFKKWLKSLDQQQTLL